MERDISISSIRKHNFLCVSLCPFVILGLGKCRPSRQRNEFTFGLHCFTETVITKAMSLLKAERLVLKGVTRNKQVA